jgi:hypothetical protein
MRTNLVVLAMILVSPPVARAQSEPDSPTPIEGLSISRQSWLREGGFLIAEITFTNGSEFPPRRDHRMRLF